MPRYVFTCSGCGQDVELDGSAESERPGRYQHLLPEYTPALGSVCGTFRRNYKAEAANVSIANLRKDREK